MSRSQIYVIGLYDWYKPFKYNDAVLVYFPILLGPGVSENDTWSVGNKGAGDIAISFISVERLHETEYFLTISEIIP